MPGSDPSLSTAHQKDEDRHKAMVSCAPIVTGMVNIIILIYEGTDISHVVTAK